MSSPIKTDTHDSSQPGSEKDKSPRVVSATMSDAPQPDLEKETTPSVKSMTMSDIPDDTDSESGDGPEDEEEPPERFDDARTQLYSHVVPLRQGLKPEDWERQKNEAVTKAMNRDLKKYDFGEPPENPQDAEDWRLQNEAALFRKINLIIYSYTQQIKDLPEKYTDKALDDCIEAIEIEEDSYPFRRPQEMSSHEEWSRERYRQKEQFDLKDAEGDAKQQRRKDRGARRGELAQPPNGWQNGLDSVIDQLSEDIPDEIRRIHKTMCILMFQWWEGGFPKEDSVKIANLNARLDTIEGGQKYKIPPTEIALWMPKLRKTLEMCEEDDSDANAKELILTAITLTNKLRKPGLDWKMVISRDTHRRFFGCINNITSEEICTLRTHFEDEYLKPRKEQMLQFGNLAEIFTPLIGEKNTNNRIQLDRLPIFMEMSQAINQKVQMCNSRLGLRQTDHNLPVADLEAAFASYITGRIPEAINYVTKFAHKVALLQINGIEDLNTACSSANGVCDTLGAQREVLDLCTGPQLSQLVEDIPCLSISANRFAFGDDVPVKTVAYGDFKGRFYINQYGPKNAPVWRIEPFPTAHWTSEYGRDPPHELCVTNVTNRFGDVYDNLGKKRWGNEHIGAYYGVAFENSIDTIDPRNLDRKYYKDNGLRLPAMDRCYILCGWDLHSEKMNYDKRWETRSTIRRFLKPNADVEIYNHAVTCENRFKKYLRGELEAQESPEGVFMAQQKAVERSIKKESSKGSHEAAELEYILPYRESERRTARRHRRAVGQAE
jgi:hypothetical protein